MKNIQCKKKDWEKNQKKFTKNLRNFFQKVTKGMKMNFKDKNHTNRGPPVPFNLQNTALINLNLN